MKLATTEQLTFMKKAVLGPWISLRSPLSVASAPPQPTVPTTVHCAAMEWRAAQLSCHIPRTCKVIVVPAAGASTVNARCHVVVVAVVLAIGPLCPSKVPPTATGTEN